MEKEYFCSVFFVEDLKKSYFGQSITFLRDFYQCIVGSLSYDREIFHAFYSSQASAHWIGTQGNAIDFPQNVKNKIDSEKYKIQKKNSILKIFTKYLIFEIWIG